MSEIDKKTLQNLRIEYSSSPIVETELDRNPFSFFGKWFDEAMAAEVREPNAMTLATATRDGVPSARIVLLKGADQNGFSFYSNYLSRKGKELAKNPFGCLVFFWPELERQVRIEGLIEKVSEAESDTYYLSRPRGSRLGAWASPQSSIIENRAVLEAKEKEFLEHFDGKEIHRPEHWGGYRLQPNRVEFWQGRSSRLHDRICFELDKTNQWQKFRLAP